MATRIGRLSARPNASAAASIIARQVGYRSSGFFAVARAITWSIASGRSFRSSLARGAASYWCE